MSFRRIRLEKPTVQRSVAPADVTSGQMQKNVCNDSISETRARLKLSVSECRISQGFGLFTIAGGRRPAAGCCCCCYCCRHCMPPFSRNAMSWSAELFRGRSTLGRPPAAASRTADVVQRTDVLGGPPVGQGNRVSLLSAFRRRRRRPS